MARARTSPTTDVCTVTITGHVYDATGQLSGTVVLPRDEAYRLVSLGMAIATEGTTTTEEGSTLHNGEESSSESSA